MEREVVAIGETEVPAIKAEFGLCKASLYKVSNGGCMRVLIITQYFWPENFAINDFALGLNGKGINVTVLTGMPNYPEGRFYSGYSPYLMRRDNYDGIEIVRVPMVPKGNGSAVRMALYYLSLAFSACLLVPVLLRKRFDLLLVYHPFVREGG